MILVSSQYLELLMVQSEAENFEAQICVQPNLTFGSQADWVTDENFLGTRSLLKWTGTHMAPTHCTRGLRGPRGNFPRVTQSSF